MKDTTVHDRDNAAANAVANFVDAAAFSLTSGVLRRVIGGLTFEYNADARRAGVSSSQCSYVGYNVHGKADLEQFFDEATSRFGGNTSSARPTAESYVRYFQTGNAADLDVLNRRLNEQLATMMKHSSMMRTTRRTTADASRNSSSNS